jgi:ubiquitin conjugation factor E4 B
MSFFVDIEFTGAHTQFHDKFTYRHHMAVVLEHLWQIPAYRASVVAAALAEPDRFVRFNNFIYNDAHYCMDEALRKLTKIRELELLQRDAAAWAALSDELRADRRSELRASEEQGGYYMQVRAGGRQGREGRQREGKGDLCQP